MCHSEIKSLHEAGMEIGSHGHTHRYFDELSCDELESELSTSCSVLAGIIDQPIDALAVPGGRIHASLQAMASRTGLKSIGTSRVAMYDSKTNPLDIPRVAIRQSTSLEEFASIVSGKPIYYSTQRLRQLTLITAKKLLGNRGYETVRNIIHRSDDTSSL